MAEVLVIGKKISEMGLVNEITGEEKIPTSALGDKAVTTGQLIEYFNNNARGSWGRIDGDISQQIDLQNEFSLRDVDLENIREDVSDHLNNQSNPHNVTATQIGLGRVDNTSDLEKPISYLTQASLDLKADNDYVEEFFSQLRKNGAALPYNESVSYEPQSVVIKDGVLHQLVDGIWISLNRASTIINDDDGLTQKQINRNRVYSVDDFSGASDSEKLSNAFLFLKFRGGRLVFNPRDYNFTIPVVCESEKRIDIYAVGAVLKTTLTTNIIDMKSTPFSWFGGEFSGLDNAKTSSHVFVKSDGAESVLLSNITFTRVNYGFSINAVKSFQQNSCKGSGARYWNVYLRSFESALIDGNDMTNNEYDGIKVGSDDTTGDQLYAKKLIITNNTGGGNTRDLIDFAVNNCELVIVANNVSDDDNLRCVDAKIVYQSTIGLKNLIIMGNTGKRSSDNVDQTFINIQGLGGVASVSKGLVVNNIAECLGSSLSSMIRIADANNIKVSNNDSDGFYYFARLTGSSNNNLIKNNTAVKCVHFVQSQDLGGRIPNSNKVCYNDAVCQGHLSGLASAFARLDSANLTEVFENEYSVVNSVYPIMYEANGTAATNTKIGKNYRGFTDSPPLGVRAVVNDTWRSSGDVTEYICNSQTASTSLGQLTKISNKGFDIGSVTQTTSASGVINVSHSLGRVPVAVIPTVSGDNQYSVKEVARSASSISFKVYDGGVPLISTEVSLNYYLS